MICSPICIKLPLAARNQVTNSISHGIRSASHGCLLYRSNTLLPFLMILMPKSANNGPYGDAILRELIPYLENHFRMISVPYARVLTGGSTGGWESLRLSRFITQNSSAARGRSILIRWTFENTAYLTSTRTTTPFSFPGLHLLRRKECFSAIPMVNR